VNALIPAFVAVLLAEIGGPLAIFTVERRTFAALAMVLLVIVAVVGGWAVAGLLIAPARVLLLGLAMLFAGFAQFGQRAPVAGKPTIVASAMMLYRSPAPFLAFAFSAWMGAPATAGVGALAGIGVAATSGSLHGAMPRVVRTGAGIILCLAGIIAALNGLRLV
jgi:hypothetical protein